MAGADIMCFFFIFFYFVVHFIKDNNLITITFKKRGEKVAELC